LPGGFRFFNGYFLYIGSYGDWWSSTEDGTYYAYFRYLYHIYVNLFRGYSNDERGLSVRCLRA
jgi:uncharacterized protein (TIGR02145 family)